MIITLPSSISLSAHFSLSDRRSNSVWWRQKISIFFAFYSMCRFYSTCKVAPSFLFYLSVYPKFSSWVTDFMTHQVFCFVLFFMNVWCSCHDKVLVYDKFANNILENAELHIKFCWASTLSPPKVFFFFFFPLDPKPCLQTNTAPVVTNKYIKQSFAKNCVHWQLLNKMFLNSFSNIFYMIMTLTEWWTSPHPCLWKN